jgi:hypothetical protein
MVNCPQIHKSSTNLPQIPHNSPHFVSEAPPFVLPLRHRRRKTQRKQGILGADYEKLRRKVRVGRAPQQWVCFMPPKSQFVVT